MTHRQMFRNGVPSPIDGDVPQTPTGAAEYDDEAAVARHQRSNTHDDLHMAGQLGLALTKMIDDLNVEYAEVNAENERLKLAVEDTSRELIQARASKLDLLQQVEDLQRENYRLSEDVRQSDADRSRLTSKFREAEELATWYRSQLEDLTPQYNTLLTRLDETQTALTATSVERDDLEQQVQGLRCGTAGSNLPPIDTALTPGTPPAGGGIMSAAGVLHSAAVGAEFHRFSDYEQRLARMQKENIQLRKDVNDWKEKATVLQQQLVGKDDELASLTAKHESHLAGCRERDEILEELRRDGYLRNDDGDEDESGGSGSEAGSSRSRLAVSRPKHHSSNLRDELSLRQLQLAMHHDKQKIEALEHSVKTLTEQNRLLSGYLADSRKKGRLKMHTFKPSSSSRLRPEAAAALLRAQVERNREASAPPQQPAVPPTIPEGSRETSPEPQAQPLPVEAVDETQGASSSSSSKSLPAPPAVPGEPHFHRRSESLPCDVGVGTSTLVDDGAVSRSFTSASAGTSPTPTARAMDVVTQESVVMVLSEQVVPATPQSRRSGDDSLLDQTITPVTPPRDASLAVEDPLRSSTPPDALFPTAVTDVAALSAVMSWAGNAMNINMAELADPLDTLRHSPAKLVADIVKECTRLATGVEVSLNRLQTGSTYVDEFLEAPSDALSITSDDESEVPTSQVSPLMRLRVYLVALTSVMRLAQSITPKMSVHTVSRIVTASRGVDHRNLPSSASAAMYGRTTPHSRNEDGTGCSYSSSEVSEKMSRSLALSTPDTDATGASPVRSPALPPETVLRKPSRPTSGSQDAGAGVGAGVGVGGSGRRALVSVADNTPTSLPPTVPQARRRTSTAEDGRGAPSRVIGTAPRTPRTGTRPHSSSMADNVPVAREMSHADAGDLESRFMHFTSKCLHRCGQQWLSSLLMVSRLAHGNKPAAPKWVPDESKKQCSGCNADFTTMNRRHHCRACGDLFCGRCSPFSMDFEKLTLLPPQGKRNSAASAVQRVCFDCQELLSCIPASGPKRIST